jgi:hypothetical protein
MSGSSDPKPNVPRSGESSSSGNQSVKPPEQTELYRALNARRISKDTFVWQTASLALAAQSFLYGIALGGTSMLGGRLISLGLSFCAAVATILLMTKHRCLEVRDSKALADLEVKFWPNDFPTPEKAPHGRPNTSGESVFLRVRSYEVWQFLQGSFALVSAVLFIALAVGGDKWLSRSIDRFAPKDLGASETARALSDPHADKPPQP